MGKGFGIAALVLSILAFFIPFVGVFISLLALAMATIAALAGDRVFAIAAMLIAAVDTFLLSPSLWVGLSGWNQTPAEHNALIAGLVAFHAAPVIGLVLNMTGKVVLGKRPQAQQ